MDILVQYPDHIVSFSPIRHSEYSIEFHLINNVWEYQGDRLLFSIVSPISDIPKSNFRDRAMCNGYTEGSHEADWLVTAAVWMRYDNVLVIMG